MKDNKFIIFTCTYNSQDFIFNCIESVKRQKYNNYVHVIVDDFSTDSTNMVIKKFKHKNLRVITNDQNKRWVCNAITYLDNFISSPDDIILIVDGDDELYGNDVLSHLNNIYNDNPDTWFTYGSYLKIKKPTDIHTSQPRPIYSKEEIDNKVYRRIDWKCAHPRSFKAFLWQKLDKNCLKLEDGTWPPYTYDKAICFPLMEMCSYDNIKHVDKIMYLYNKKYGQSSSVQKPNGGFGAYYRSLPTQDTLII